MNTRPSRLIALTALFLPALAAQAVTVIATYKSATDVPVTASSYTATGNTVEFKLNYAPTTGTTLMVVKNTGLAFITGTCSNLAQGQHVALSFGGTIYPFVANYFGGTGNDLVLQWAKTKLLGWGEGSEGQLGNNSATRSPVPVEMSTAGVLAGKTITAVVAGAEHSLVLCSDGTVVASGDNTAGQLGNNSRMKSLVPVAVNTTSGVSALSGKTVIALAVGSAHSLALCSDGTLATWGWNESGQLGNNSTMDSPVPVAVNTAGVLSGKTVIAVAAGDRHNLALCADGNLVAWGENCLGELGNNSTENSTVPVAVSTAGVLSGKNVIAVSAGSHHNLVMCSDGTLAAWGYNSYGQLGYNSTMNSPVPVAVNTTGVLSGKSVVALASGDCHNLALCSDGTLVAWGDNREGQLGDNSMTQSNVPVVVNTTGALAGKTVSAVAAGSRRSLALCSDGTLTAWGDNTGGRLGSTSTTDFDVTSPVLVSTASLAPGERFVMGTSSPSAWCIFGIVAMPPLSNHSHPGACR